ncbi:hypothetical protein [Limnospira fusiformis]|nr:hypothetical protein HFV01_22165 [Limnospira fusiformis SAG 85.79]
MGGVREPNTNISQWGGKAIAYLVGWVEYGNPTPTSLSGEVRRSPI